MGNVLEKSTARKDANTNTSAYSTNHPGSRENGLTFDPMGDTEDDNVELDDNSNHGRRVHPVKPDSEACDKETTNDSVDVINKTADDVKEEPVTLNSASKGKAARKSIPREGVHSSPIGAGLEDDKAKQEDNSIEDETEVKKSIECIEKEIKHGKACYCTKCCKRTFR